MSNLPVSSFCIQIGSVPNLLFVSSTKAFSGWGYTHPKTVLGKLFCMIYASFGVPLYIVVIGSNGESFYSLSVRIH